MNWLSLDTGACPAAWNMALDVHLAHAVQDGRCLPVLRLYGWQPHAVSLGFHQDEGDFNRDALDADGLHLVRRPTGGKAILHAEELTYSVAMPVDPMGPREIYRWLNIGLLRALDLLGIRATLARVDDHFPSLYRNKTSIPCFSSSARSEIQVAGRKIIGSAQRRYGSAILQHGSILLGPAHKTLVRYLAEGTGGHAREMEQSLQQKTIDARSALGRIVSYEEAAQAVRRGFAEALNIDFTDTNVHDLAPLIGEGELLGEYQ